MKLNTTLALAAILAGSAGMTQAMTLEYASGVVSYDEGAGVSGDRDNTANALGAPDGEFLSLGLGGTAEFSFDDSPFGSPASVFEITFGDPGDQPESAAVYGVDSEGTWEWLTAVNNTDAQGGAEFEFSGNYETLRVMDNTLENYGEDAASKDGFDLDAVGVSPVPLPAGGLLLAGALGGFGGFGAWRRKRSA